MYVSIIPPSQNVGLPDSVTFNESTGENGFGDARSGHGHFVFSKKPEHLGQWTRYFGRDMITGERKFSNNV